MKVREFLVAATVSASFLLTGCTAEVATQTQREDMFWTEYEKRMGLVGTDYADPVEARNGSIEYGYFLCSRLEQGMDRDVLIVRAAGSTSTTEEVETAVNTAVEFLCPEQGE